MTQGRQHPGRDDTKAYLVGGGIASLASAAYLIRDGGVAGEHIVIFEATDVIGGSLDGDGSPQHSYVIRGGRMSSSTVRRGPPPISPLVAARIPATAASSPVSVSPEFVNKTLVRVADINSPAYRPEPEQLNDLRVRHEAARAWGPYLRMRTMTDKHANMPGMNAPPNKPEHNKAPAQAPKPPTSPAPPKAPATKRSDEPARRDKPAHQH